jgi:hypothetical protein
MKKHYPINSLLSATSRKLSLGLVASLSVFHLAVGQQTTGTTSKTITTGTTTTSGMSSSSSSVSSVGGGGRGKVLSTITENGITTQTYSSGAIVKTVADGYYLDTAFYKNGNVLKETRAPRKWKITDRIGLAQPVCNGTDDRTMFLKTGFFNNLSADHYWGKIGVGLMGGYQNFGVREDEFKDAVLANVDNLSRTAPALGINRNTTAFTKTNNFEDFYLLLGPVVSLPIAKKLSLDLGLRGGIFNSSAVSLGANSTAPSTSTVFDTRQSIYRVSPGAKRMNLGAQFGVDLLYSIAQNWGLGLTANGFITHNNYLVSGLVNDQGRVTYRETAVERQHGGWNAGLALSHTFATCDKKTVYTLLPPPPAQVTCFTPALEGASGKVYEYGSTDIPTFSWKSASTSPETEDYIFKFYRADGTGSPVFQQTTKNRTMTLPNSVALGGDEGGFYYYTVQSSVEGKCLSEAAAASVVYKSKPLPPAVIPATKPAEEQYMFKIFGGSTATKYFGSPAPVRRVRRRAIARPTTVTPSPAVSAPAVSGDVKPAVKKRVVPRRKKVVSSGSGSTGSVTNSSTVNYENVTNNPNIQWPADLPLPKQPAVYEFEVQRLSSGDCKPTGTVAKYKFYIDPKNPNDLKLVPDKPKRNN